MALKVAAADDDDDVNDDDDDDNDDVDVDGHMTCAKKEELEQTGKPAAPKIFEKDSTENDRKKDLMVLRHLRFCLNGSLEKKALENFSFEVERLLCEEFLTELVRIRALEYLYFIFHNYKKSINGRIHPHELTE
jgi:hypothetical protein